MNDLSAFKAQIAEIEKMSPGDSARDRAALNTLGKIIGETEPFVRTRPCSIGVDPPDRREDPERVRLSWQAREARDAFMRRWHQSRTA